METIRSGLTGGIVGTGFGAMHGDPAVDSVLFGALGLGGKVPFRPFEKAPRVPRGTPEQVQQMGQPTRMRMAEGRQRQEFRERGEQEAYWQLEEPYEQLAFYGITEAPPRPGGQGSRMEQASRAATRTSRSARRTQQKARQAEKRAAAAEAHGDPAFTAVVRGQRPVYMRPEESVRTEAERDFQSPTAKQRKAYGLQHARIPGTGEFWWNPDALQARLSELGIQGSVRTPKGFKRLIGSLDVETRGRVLYGPEADLTGSVSLTARDAQGREITTVQARPESVDKMSQRLREEGAAEVEVRTAPEVLAERVEVKRQREASDALETREGVDPDVAPARTEPRSVATKAESQASLEPHPLILGYLRRAGHTPEDLPEPARPLYEKLTRSLERHGVTTIDELPADRSHGGRRSILRQIDQLFGTMQNWQQTEVWNRDVVPEMTNLGLARPAKKRSSPKLPDGGVKGVKEQVDRLEAEALQRSTREPGYDPSKTLMSVRKVRRALDAIETKVRDIRELRADVRRRSGEVDISSEAKLDDPIAAARAFDRALEGELAPKLEARARKLAKIEKPLAEQDADGLRESLEKTTRAMEELGAKQPRSHEAQKKWERDYNATQSLWARLKGLLKDESGTIRFGEYWRNGGGNIVWAPFGFDGPYPRVWQIPPPPVPTFEAESV